MFLADSLTLLAHFFTAITKKDVCPQSSFPQSLTMGAARPRKKAKVNLYKITFLHNF